MGKWVRLAAMAAASALCGLFGAMLLVYMRPQGDQVFDLSLRWHSEAMPEDWVYDQKGWTMFTQEGDRATPLTADGLGGFTGMDEPGQTFYYARTLWEEVDSPTLRLSAGDLAIAVFLDDVLLYTDCPELDNRVGRLRLPILEWHRDEPVTVTLPQDYRGKTLTVAQSTSPIPEREDGRVYPLDIALYSSYAYESGLIAESFQTAVPASLVFAAGASLLLLFVLQVFRGAPDMKTVCGALLAFFWLAVRLREASFARYYFPTLPVDMISLFRDLSLTLLLVFLSAHLTGRRRVLLGVLTGAQGLTVLVKLVLDLTGNTSFELFPLAGLAALLTALGCGTWEWKGGNRFYSWFCTLSALGLACWGGMLALSVWRGGHLAAKVWQQAALGASGYFLFRLALLATAAALAGAIAEAVREEIARRTQTRLLVQRAELAQDSYEAMRAQHTQVMMLRHDMAKHFRLLRQMTDDPKTAEYLDSLIGTEEQIRPVVQCGNEILDIILNSKLSAAADAGIEVELMRMQAPPQLPLCDAELCSLVVNLMDNALAAAGAPGVERRYIKLDIHIKNGFFALTCENSATPEWIHRKNAPGHGLGLEIVRQIVKRYGNLTKTEYGEDFYKVTVVLPLRQPLR